MDDSENLNQIKSKESQKKQRSHLTWSSFKKTD